MTDVEIFQSAFFCIYQYIEIKKRLPIDRETSRKN